jgi:hypothetical protein
MEDLLLLLRVLLRWLSGYACQLVFMHPECGGEELRTRLAGISEGSFNSDTPTSVKALGETVVGPHCDRAAGT